jgi:hypothetical protein
MTIILRSIVLAALMSVSGVHRVSGFTQTDTERDRDEGRSSQSVVGVYVAGENAALERVACAPNLKASAAYQSLVDAMLVRSPTFRRQCARIAAAPYLSVIIRSDPPVGTRARALTEIQRLSGGRVEAFVKVGFSAETGELIAHEIEHILEQLDGVDLPVKARLRGSGVRRLAELEAYETTRAIVTGQRVAREAFERRR